MRPSCSSNEAAFSAGDALKFDIIADSCSDAARIGRLTVFCKRRGVKNNKSLKKSIQAKPAHKTSSN